MGLRNHVLDGAPDCPMQRGNFYGKGHAGMPDSDSGGPKEARVTWGAHWCHLVNMIELCTLLCWSRKVTAPRAMSLVWLRLLTRSSCTVST